MPAFFSRCSDLVSQILVVNPVERISLEEIQRHPWMNGISKMPPIRGHMATSQTKGADAMTKDRERPMPMHENDNIENTNIIMIHFLCVTKQSKVAPKIRRLSNNVIAKVAKARTQVRKGQAVMIR